MEDPIPEYLLEHKGHGIEASGWCMVSFISEKSETLGKSEPGRTNDTHFKYEPEETVERVKKTPNP